jgi:hypothetical protein
MHRFIAAGLAVVLAVCGAIAVSRATDRAAPVEPAPRADENRQLQASAQPTLVVRPRGWAILRNQPFGIAIGNGRPGWGMDAAYPSKNPHYIAGYVHGGFKGCAWTAVTNVARTRGPEKKVCAGFNPRIRSFASKLNCWCAGGTAVLLTAPAREYANFRNGVGGYDYLRTVPARRCVEWRWVSIDKTMVMVKDRAVANNLGSWIFVPRSSLPLKLPRGYARSCNAKRLPT